MADTGINIVVTTKNLTGEEFAKIGTALKDIGDVAVSTGTTSEGAFKGLFGTIAGGTAAGHLLADAFKKVGEVGVEAFIGIVEIIPELVNHVTELGAELFDLSNKTGISVESLSQLSYAAGQAGTDLNTITGAIFKMETALGKGGKEIETAFNRIGLSIAALKGMRPEDAFTAIIDAIGKLPTQADQAAAGMAIFSRQFSELANLTKEDIKGLIAEADHLGLTMTTETAVAADAVDDAFARISAQFESLGDEIGAAFLPAVATALNLFSENFHKALSSAGISADMWAKQVQAILTFTVQAFGLMVQGIQPAMNVLIGFFAGDFIRSMAVIDALAGVADAIVRVAEIANLLNLGGALTKQLDSAKASLAQLHTFARDGIAATTAAYAGASTVIDAAVKATEATIDGFGKAYQKTKDEIAAAAAAMRADQAHVGHAFVDMSDEAKKALEKLEAAAKKMAETLKSIEGLDAGFPTYIGNIGRADMESVEFGKTLKLLAEIEKEVATGAATGASKFASMGFAAEDAGKSVKKLGASLHDDLLVALASVPGTIAAAFTGGGGLVGAAQSIGSTFGSLLGQHIGTAISATSKIAGPIGAAIGSLAGPLIGMFADLLDHTKEDIEHMGASLGESFSDGLVQQMEKDADRVGDEVAGMLLNLSARIKEAGGVMEFGFENATARAHDLFSQIETGKLTVKEAGTVFADVFGQLAAALEETGGLASKTFLDLLRLNTQFGTNAASVTKFIADQMKSAFGGLTQFINNATVTTQAGANGVISALALMFDELGSGSEEVQSLVKKLQDQLAAAGLTGGAAFDAIARMAAYAGQEIVGKAVAAASGLDAVIKGLHNTNRLTAQSFADIAAQVYDIYRGLELQGQGGVNAYQSMQGPLQTIWELQQEFGYQVDAATQNLIDQAVEAGIVGDAHRSAADKAARAMEQVVNKLGQIVDALGRIIPAAGGAANAAAGVGTAAERAADDTENAANSMVESWQSVKNAAELAAGASPTGVELYQQRVAEAMSDTSVFGDVAMAVFGDVKGSAEAVGWAVGAVIDDMEALQKRRISLDQLLDTISDPDERRRIRAELNGVRGRLGMGEFIPPSLSSIESLGLGPRESGGGEGGVEFSVPSSSPREVSGASSSVPAGDWIVEVPLYLNDEKVATAVLRYLRKNGMLGMT